MSCGYEAEYIELGIGRGMQTNILGNHLALVSQGRAGASYAINDQQGAKMKKLGDKIKGIFAKAGDEAAKVVDEVAGGDKDKADDKAPAWADKLTKTMEKVADGLTQVASMSQPSKMGDEDKEDDKDKKDAKDAEGEKKDDAKDEGEEAPAWAKALIARIEKLEGKSSDEESEEEAEDDGEEMEDAEGEEESEDDDFEESPAAKTGDEASRIEILAPGFKAKGKDAKRSALIEASKSKDTAAIITRLNGGKSVDLKKASSKTIDHLFIGASEVVGLYRTKNFAKWKQVRDSQEEVATGDMTPEKINEINEKHYAQKGVH